MGLIIIFVVIFLFSTSGKVGNKTADLVKPHAKNSLFIIIIVIAAFIALASAKGK